MRYVFSKDFMKENVICVNNNQIYKKNYDPLLKEPKINFILTESEGLNEEIIQEKCVNKILSFA